jgi:hypothetical protein
MKFILFVFVLLTAFRAAAQLRLAQVDLVPEPPAAATTEQSLSLEPTVTETSKQWLFLLPTFVVHGIRPSGTVAEEMPRKLDPSGQAVATPGFGFEYQGESSLDVILAFVKDCYDHYAGTIQFGQYLKLNSTFQIGYSLGLYIRETPVMCYTDSVTTTTTGGSTRGGRGTNPAKTNTLSYTTCGFADNFPIRYVTKSGDGYIDIIPSPFLNASARLYHGDFDVDLKILSNFYLSEVGLAIPF